MGSYLEYDVLVKRVFPASVAAFGFFLLTAFVTPMSRAQVNGALPTSGAGHMTGGVPSPTGPVRPPTGTVPNVNSLVPNRVPRNSSSGDHPHRHRDAVGPVWYAVPVPYPVDAGAYNDATDDPDAEDNSNYQGGPTVFDRRGDGAESYVPPQEDIAPFRSPYRGDYRNENAVSDPPPPTVLIFKDGHKLEVGNYAIIGPTLFDMTPGHSRKVPLADLDLESTRDQNEAHGMTFQVPMSSQAN
jgi:hypothetical protein